MPRAASRRRPPASASWLLAPPADHLRLEARDRRSLRTAPSAQGATMSTSADKQFVGGDDDRAVETRCLERRVRPNRRRRRDWRRPDAAGGRDPCRRCRRPASRRSCRRGVRQAGAPPHAASTGTRRSAVHGDGSPPALPPPLGRPATCGVTLRDRLHVVDSRAHVLGGDVACRRGNRPPCRKPRTARPVELSGGTQDDCLAAAEGQAGEGVLVGHAGGKPHGVGDRMLRSA